MLIGAQSNSCVPDPTCAWKVSHILNLFPSADTRSDISFGFVLNECQQFQPTVLTTNDLLSFIFPSDIETHCGRPVCPGPLSQIRSSDGSNRFSASQPSVSLDLSTSSAPSSLVAQFFEDMAARDVYIYGAGCLYICIYGVLINRKTESNLNKLLLSSLSLIISFFMMNKINNELEKMFRFLLQSNRPMPS